jgi:hypothetical protein
MRLCYFGSYSAHAGSTTALCSGPCDATYQGTHDVIQFHTQTSPTCHKTCAIAAFCPIGSIDPIPCRAGTSNGLIGQGTSDSCISCVERGQYCPEGSSQPLMCPLGTYCPTSAKELACPAGTYGGQLGLYRRTCSGPCARGFLCTEFSVSDKQQPCPPGQYNNDTGRMNCSRCEQGTYAEQSVLGTAECRKCGLGQYVSVEGASQCLVCPPGPYANTTASARCTWCPAGTYAERPSVQRVRRVSTAQTPAHHYVLFVL